jgi:predicted CoA-binding protein
VRQLNDSSALELGEEPVIETLSRINPSDIEMIEVFRGPSEIPGIYHWNGCAVIAIWTRWNE